MMDMFDFLEDAGRKLDAASRTLPQDQWYAGYVLGEAGFPCPPTAPLNYREGWKAGTNYNGGSQDD